MLRSVRPSLGTEGLGDLDLLVRVCRALPPSGLLLQPHLPRRLDQRRLQAGGRLEQVRQGVREQELSLENLLQVRMGREEGGIGLGR